MAVISMIHECSFLLYGDSNGMFQSNPRQHLGMSDFQQPANLVAFLRTVMQAVVVWVKYFWVSPINQKIRTVLVLSQKRLQLICSKQSCWPVLFVFDVLHIINPNFIFPYIKDQNSAQVLHVLNWFDFGNKTTPVWVIILLHSEKG